MPRRNTVFGHCLVALALIAPGLVSAATPTAGKQVRFKLSLVVTGHYEHTGPKTIPQGALYLTIKQAIDNSYSTEYVVVPNTILTGLQKTNPLDPR